MLPPKFSKKVLTPLFNRNSFAFSSKKPFPTAPRSTLQFLIIIFLSEIIISLFFFKKFFISASLGICGFLEPKPHRSTSSPIVISNPPFDASFIFIEYFKSSTSHLGGFKSSPVSFNL